MAAGRHQPDRSSDDPDGTRNREATFTVPDKVRAYSGFTGVETRRSQRNEDPLTNQTLLSGDLEGDDVPGEPWNGDSSVDNAYHAVTFVGVSPSTILDGFTVTGGGRPNAMGTSAIRAAAGVLLRTLQTFARHSTPTLTMNLYARTLQGSLADAANRLPDFSRSDREVLRATGTDHATADAPATGGRTGGKAAHGGSAAFPTTHDSTDARDDGSASASPTGAGDNVRTEAHRSERGWMGIEPTTSRVNDPSTALKAAGPTRRPDTPPEKPHCNTK